MGEEDRLENGRVEIKSSPTTELKRDLNCLDTETESYPNKKQAKEVSNDDIRSEVSNPVVSPKENENENASSFQDISSQPAKLEDSSDRVECGEVMSSCSEDGSLCVGEPAENDTGQIETENVDTSRVVVEINKPCVSSGIRKITFKFSKRKEDYENQSYEGESGELDGRSLGGRERSHATVGEVEPKKVPEGYPSNVKKLLGTGILDGARVKYVSTGAKVVLDGIISGGGYLCGCSSCNYTNVISAFEFEQHAGVKTRHPNNHIFLENGRPVYNIIQELKTAPLNKLDEALVTAAGSAINEGLFRIWKESLFRFDGDEVSKRHSVKFPKPWLPKKSKLPKFPHSLPRSSSHTPCSAMYQKKAAGRGSKKSRDHDLHRLLFMPNGLPDGAKLAYYMKGQRILGGYKHGNGIICNCCNEEISPSQFEAHAGMSARRQPYRHIYISNGLTLHDIAMSLANGQNLTTGASDGSDDMCAVCGHDSGKMILCDGCPRAFHEACLGSECIPESDWHCPNCVDNFERSRKTPAGGSSSITRPIVIRLTREFKAPEIEIGGCVLCRSNDFSAAIFDDRTVIICDQCEKEFHVGCLRGNGLCDLKELPKDKWFCCDDCSRISEALQDIIHKEAEQVPAPLSDPIIRKHADRDIFIDGVADVKWRIFSGKSRCPEHLPFLSSAAAIFRECFDPIVAKSGRDLIPVMVYGRNISGQEFGGMYCVVLTVRSVVVSAGLLRIFGKGVAELPIVATSREHQGKGYFQALFSCIEMLLLSLKVEKLVLPAAEEAESIWTKKLGFRKMSDEQYSNYMREVQLTVFMGTSMLEKMVQSMD